MSGGRIEETVRDALSPENWRFKERASEAHLRIEKFVEKHFAALAFFFSCALLFLTAPGTFLTGTLIGAVAHSFYNPMMRIQKEERKIPLLNATVAIVGAFASVLRYTPAGLMGGKIFHSIPFVSSLAVGSSAYRIYSAYKH